MIRKELRQELSTANVETRKVFVLHQYLDKNHFRALYECGKIYGYEIEDYYVADCFFIFKNMIKKEIFHRKQGLSWKEGIAYLRKQRELKEMENELVIVGLAPYDSLLFKYENLVKNNISVYFSSWQVWDGSSFPRGKISNRDRWEKILKQDFDGAACVSLRTRNCIEKFIKDSVVVNHAISVENYITKRDYSRTNNFLFLGRFEDAKNIQFILEWIKKNPGRKCYIDFAGFGTYQHQIEKLAKVDKRVNYLGMLNKSEIEKVIYKYDFTLLPSKFEPFGITLIESLAAGTPCVTSNACGPSEIINDGINGLVCDKDSYDSFSKTMDKALSMTSYDYEMLCKNAEKEGKKYSSEVIASKWCELFDRLLQ